MNIALIVTGLSMGGAERQVCDLADQFVSLGHRVMLVSLTGEAISVPKNTAIDIRLLRMEKSLLGFLLAYYRLRKLLLAFSPDVVHSHMVHANLFARLLRLTMKMSRLICTAHSSYEGGRLIMLSYRLTDFLADISTNVSEEAVQEFVARGAVEPGRMVAVHNGIDTACFRFSQVERDVQRQELGVVDNSPLVLAVGRLTEAKDYPNMFRAFMSVTAIFSTAKLAIVGDGELQADLAALAEQAGISKSVMFLGLRLDVAGLMSAADVFVLSSGWEGFGLVVAEAMACERLVVATDSGGVKEVLGQAGYLVPTQDSNALAGGILNALALPVQKSKLLGREARARVVDCFSLEVAVSKWLALYKK